MSNLSPSQFPQQYKVITHDGIRGKVIRSKPFSNYDEAKAHADSLNPETNEASGHLSPTLPDDVVAKHTSDTPRRSWDYESGSFAYGRNRYAMVIRKRKPGESD